MDLVYSAAAVRAACVQPLKPPTLSGRRHCAVYNTLSEIGATETGVCPATESAREFASNFAEQRALSPIRPPIRTPKNRYGPRRFRPTLVAGR